MKNELVVLDLERIENEKTQLERKIEREAKKAIESLTQGELQALANLVKGHEEPKVVLTQMGISPSIQDPLLKVLEGL